MVFSFFNLTHLTPLSYSLINEINFQISLSIWRGEFEDTIRSEKPCLLG